ncbi:MAG TPA: cysteine-rich CWC family protein [Chitinophagaceae bacterium]
MCTPEKKTCPRCSASFECKADTITECQCYHVQLNSEERMFIEECYDDCLCKNCLLELKSRYLVFKDKYLWK